MRDLGDLPWGQKQQMQLTFTFPFSVSPSLCVINATSLQNYSLHATTERASERANPTSSAAAMNNSLRHHSLGSFESVGGVNDGGGKAIDPCRIH